MIADNSQKELFLIWLPFVHYFSLLLWNKLKKNKPTFNFKDFNPASRSHAKIYLFRILKDERKYTCVYIDRWKESKSLSALLLENAWVCDVYVVCLKKCLPSNWDVFPERKSVMLSVLYPEQKGECFIVQSSYSLETASPNKCLGR